MITIEDLREAERHLEKQLAAVKNHILALVGSSRGASRTTAKTEIRKRRKMSAKGRAAIAAAQKKRWAAVKAKTTKKD